MTNIELLLDSLNAAEQAYIGLCLDERIKLNKDYDFYNTLTVLRRIADRAVYESKEREQKQNDLENSNEY